MLNKCLSIACIHLQCYPVFLIPKHPASVTCTQHRKLTLWWFPNQKQSLYFKLKTRNWSFGIFFFFFFWKWIIKSLRINVWDSTMPPSVWCFRVVTSPKDQLIGWSPLQPLIGRPYWQQSIGSVWVLFHISLTLTK